MLREIIQQMEKLINNREEPSDVRTKALEDG